MLKHIKSTVLLFLLLQPVVALAVFPDVPEDHHNYVAVNFLQEQQILTGYEDGSYKPEQIVNRAEALKLILAVRKIEIPEQFEKLAFSDTDNTAWYAKYVAAAKQLGIVSGNPDGTFTPARSVVRAEFIKMLLIAFTFNGEKWTGVKMFEDVPEAEWYTPYMNYAGQAGLVTKDSLNKLYPAQPLTRGEVAEILYIMSTIVNGKNTQFLISQAEAQMSQIDIYVGNNDPLAAKRASELAVDMTQQAYKNMPDDKVVLGAAKLARAYEFVVNAYLNAIQQKYPEARDWANQAIAKATEAWEVNNDTQKIARHIKDRANEINSQLPAN